MTYRHARAQDLLAALAPPKRFELVALLARGRDLSVSGLALEVGLSQSCTTRHLQALERAGLVRGVRDGKRVVFHLRPSDPTANRVLAALLPQGAAFAPADDEGAPRRVAPAPATTGSRATRMSRAVAIPASVAVERHSASSVAGASSQASDAVRIAPAAPEGKPVPASPDPLPSASEVAVASPTPRESGNESSEPTPRPRARNEIEDFLL
ncbi:MAG: hypothetical protein RL721_2407, partial [Candidatus Eisenbacteria bacterium]|jgi:DNA-binding transcriptional ArsR family regulator